MWSEVEEEAVLEEGLRDAAREAVGGGGEVVVERVGYGHGAGNADARAALGDDACFGILEADDVAGANVVQAEPVQREGMRIPEGFRAPSATSSQVTMVSKRRSGWANPSRCDPARAPVAASSGLRRPWRGRPRGGRGPPRGFRRR